MTRQIPTYRAIAIKVSREVQSIGLKQWTLARKLGWHQSVVSEKLGNKRALTVKDLYELAEVLGVKPGQLLPDEEEAQDLFRWARKMKPNALEIGRERT